MTGTRRLRAVATRYPHFGRYAGIGQFTRHLPSLGYEVDYRLVGDDDSGLPLPRGAAGQRLREHLRERVQRSGMAWYKLSDLAEELRTLPAVISRRARIVHFLDGEHGVQFLPAWLRALPGPRPVIVASYHQPPAMLPELLDPAVIRRLDAVVLVAPTQEPFFADLLPPERVVTILHGVDIRHFHPRRAAPLEAGDDIVRCVTAGHWLRDWEAMRAAAEALQGDAGIEFHLVTDRQTGLEHLPNVHRHHGLSDDELAELYRRCDIGLLPLVDSTANNSLLEFIASGLPLVSTALASVRAYVGEDAAVLLPPGERAGFAAAILALRSDPARRVRMGAAARRRAEQLAWPIVAERYAALYDRLLSSTSPRRAA